MEDAEEENIFFNWKPEFIQGKKADMSRRMWKLMMEDRSLQKELKEEDNYRKFIYNFLS